MIKVKRQDAAVWLTLQRAEKKNAMTEAMWGQLLQALADVAEEHRSSQGRAPRALVLAGEAGAFCAGADIAELTQLLRDPAAMAANNALVARAQLALEQLPLPTLALIDGPCFGGGFGLAAACDFRIASQRASFAITPARLGLVYSIEDTRRVVRLLGDTQARRLLLRGQPLDAATAHDWGMLDALVDADALQTEAQAWLADICAQSPLSMAGIKATLAYVGHAGVLNETQVRAAFDAAFDGADFREGATAFLERRPARFL